MAVELPPLSCEELISRLGAQSESVSPTAGEALWRHYCELRRWATRSSLIGPGTAENVIERHYAESLAALPVVAEGGDLVDVGSGAGFPGLILAAVAAQLQVTLVESRRRKAAFLAATARKMGVTTKVRAERIGRDLPAGIPARIDFLTLRAVRLDRRSWPQLVARLARGSRVVVWTGREEPELPGGLVLEDQILLPGSHRRVQIYRQRGRGGHHPPPR